MSKAFVVWILAFNFDYESWFSGEFIEIGRIIDSEHEESEHVQGKVSTHHIPQVLLQQPTML